MADLHHNEQQQQQQQQQYQHPNEASKGFLPQRGPSASQVLAVATLVPIGGTLLFLAGLTLVGTIIVLAVSAPLFVIFSPVLVPAALVIALAVAGILTSGAFGITALSSFHWLANYLGRMRFPEQMEHTKHRLQDTAADLAQKAKDTEGDLGQKTKETGQNVQLKAQDVGRTQEGESGRGHDSGRAQVSDKRGRPAHESGRAQEGIKA